MVRKVSASRIEDSFSPSESSDSTSTDRSAGSETEARASTEADLPISTGESTRSVFEERDGREGSHTEGDEPEVSQPCREERGLSDTVDPESLQPGREGYEAGEANCSHEEEDGGQGKGR
ncbi:hypothetical protein LWI29_024423 [Acer saccharum]|uniref:Uncharacterized protein n=1 Tax=Acer saccharum TaxID=4024 RepID=A0AA39RII1_ACESA|nr:hypothetical protein LWI29_024423 [Acer saccharum]